MTTNTQRPPKPAQMQWITPYLTVSDVSQAMDFYVKAFGFEKSESMPGPDGKIVHGSMNFQGQTVAMFGAEGAFGNTCKSPAASGIASPVSLYVYCPDVDSLCARAKAGCAKLKSEPADMFWGDRVVEFEDIDGYRWTFATNVADFDASKAPKECWQQ